MVETPQIADLESLNDFHMESLNTGHGETWVSRLTVTDYRHSDSGGFETKNDKKNN